MIKITQAAAYSLAVIGALLLASVVYFVINKAFDYNEFDSMRYNLVSDQVIVVDKGEGLLSHYITFEGLYRKEYKGMVSTKKSSSINVPEHFLNYVVIGEVITHNGEDLYSIIRNRVLKHKLK